MKGQAAIKESLHMLPAQRKVKPLLRLVGKLTYKHQCVKQDSLRQPLQSTDPKESEVRVGGVPSEAVCCEIPISKHESRRRIWTLTSCLNETGLLELSLVKSKLLMQLKKQLSIIGYRLDHRRQLFMLTCRSSYKLTALTPSRLWKQVPRALALIPEPCSSKPCLPSAYAWAYGLVVDTVVYLGFGEFRKMVESC